MPLEDAPLAGQAVGPSLRGVDAVHGRMARRRGLTPDDPDEALDFLVGEVLDAETIRELRQRLAHKDAWKQRALYEEESRLTLVRRLRRVLWEHGD